MIETNVVGGVMKYNWTFPSLVLIFKEEGASYALLSMITFVHCSELNIDMSPSST